MGLDLLLGLGGSAVVIVDYVVAEIEGFLSPTNFGIMELIVALSRGISWLRCDAAVSLLGSTFFQGSWTMMSITLLSDS